MILAIQFRQDVTEAHEQTCIRERMAAGDEIRFISIFDETINFAEPAALLKGVDRLILGGSAGLSIGAGHSENDYAKVGRLLSTIEPLVRYVLAHDFPTLGTCFGHQLLAHFAGGVIAYDQDKSETGAFDITLTAEGITDPLFDGVPSVFSAIEGHQDTVIIKPKSAVILASSERAEIQALRYGKNVYGTQFHSELNEQDLLYRLSLFPEYTTHATTESMVIPPSPYGIYILRNFLNAQLPTATLAQP